MTQAEQVTEPVVVHGETPVYDRGTGRLHWVDMNAGDVMSMDVRDAISNPVITRLHVGQKAAAWRPRVGGGGVIGTQNGFALIDPDETVHQRPAFSDPKLWMNDGSCDPQGRFYCGNIAADEAVGAGSLYRLDPDGSITTVLTDTTISNGISWSVDGSLVYYIDSPTQRVDVFDFDAATGTLHNRRPVIEIDPAIGTPDGLTIDAEGGIWVALWAGSAVHRYTLDGKLSDVISLPATQVTACAFGGPDLDRLYITTSRRDIDPSVQPAAGALFAAIPGVHGVPVLMYGG